jgi:hypothetical protein
MTREAVLEDFIVGSAVKATEMVKLYRVQKVSLYKCLKIDISTKDA